MNKIASIFLVPLQGLLNTLQSERHYKDHNKDEALKSIHTALLETKKFIELSEGQSNREKEYELAQLWADASVKSRLVSKELCNRLDDKSKYWSDTIEWSREEILEKKIDFDSIELQINTLLGK